MNTAEIDLALAQARLEAICDVLEVRSNANGRMYVARPTCLKVLDYWTRRVAELEAQTETPPNESRSM